MGKDKLLHAFEGSQTIGDVFRDRVWLMMVIGNVFYVECKYFSIEFVCFSLIFVCFDLKDDASSLHSENILNLMQSIA